VIPESPQPEKRPIVVNTASVEALNSVVGIGRTLAERIVAYRQEHGPFSALSELIDVPGIGPAVLRRIADQLTVGESAPVAAEAEPPPATEPPQEGETPTAEEAKEAPPEPGEPPEEMVEQVEEPPDEAIEEPEQVKELPVAAEAEQVKEATPVEEQPAQEPTQEQELAQPEPIAAEAEAEPEPEPPAEPVVQEEPKPVERVGEAVEPTPAEVEEAPAEPAPKEEAPVAAEVRRKQPPQPEPPHRRRVFWHDFWLVLLGGLAGVALTVIVTVIWTGTLDFAPRSEMEALSRNLDTMQSNHEQAWQRIDAITLGTEELGARVAELEKLTGRVDSLESALDQAQSEIEKTQGDLAQTQDSVDELSKELASLSEKVIEELVYLGNRVDKTEDDLAALSASFGRLEEAFGVVQVRVQQFDAFFTALRDLLLDLEGLPGQPAKAKSMYERRPTLRPTVTSQMRVPTPTPAAYPTVTKE